MILKMSRFWGLRFADPLTGLCPGRHWGTSDPQTLAVRPHLAKSSLNMPLMSYRFRGMAISVENHKIFLPRVIIDAVDGVTLGNL